MAKLFRHNIELDVTYDGIETAGTLFEIKELLVSAGWSVVGSSADFAFEFSGVTGGAGTGSGGAYDLWDTAADADRSRRWMVVEQPGGGRQYLFYRLNTSDSANFSMSPGGNFTSAGVTPSVPPVASDHRFIWQTTTSADFDIYVPTTQGILNLWALDNAVNGEYAWGFFVADGTSSTSISHCFGVVPVDNADPSDTEPLAFYWAANTDLTWQATNPKTGNFEGDLDNVDGYSGFGPGESGTRPGQSSGGEDLAAPVYLSNASPEAFIKGTVDTDLVLMKGANRNYPNLFRVGTAPNEVYYIYSSNLSYLVPWCNEGTTPTV